MGLLDQVLGAVLKQGGQGQAGAGGMGDLLSGLTGAGQRQGGGAGNLLALLLPAVLAMLQNRGGGAAGSAGLGGLGGLLQQFQAAGLGQHADSWVGSGQNLPLSAEQITSALGSERVSALAAQAGLSEAQTSTGLAELLPELVNQLTPHGQLPAEEEVEDVLGGLRKSLGA